MHEQFGQDHQRQRDQQAHVQFHVVEEGQAFERLHVLVGHTLGGLCETAHAVTALGEA